MIAFDTDILTEILLGTPAYLTRAAAVPPGEQGVPIVVVEEIIRGRLEMIRRAEAGKGTITLERAYQLFEQNLNDFRRLVILPYTAEAETRFTEWRRQKIRVSTHDLRIAAIALTHSATLISRNRADFQQVPGLTVEFWE
jgi:tRNA(fMet)-specific endonuclease VapC